VLTNYANLFSGINCALVTGPGVLPREQALGRKPGEKRAYCAPCICIQRKWPRGGRPLRAWVRNCWWTAGASAAGRNGTL